MTGSRTTEEVIQSIIDWAEKRDSIRAVLLTSTRAIAESRVDIFSDYDVILVIRDIHPFVDEHGWLDDFGEVLVAYWDDIYRDPSHGMEACGNVTQYRDGLKIDFTLWPVRLVEKIVASGELPAELDAGYRVLLDKDQVTDAMARPTGKAYVPERPPQALYHRWINDFLSDAPYAAKCLWRGELLPAKWCLDHDMKQVYLRRMLEWYAEELHGWSMPVGALGKGLKNRLPPELWKALEQCYAGAEVEENWEALFRTMELFRRVALMVGDQLGYGYPEELHESVREYVEIIRRSEGSL